MSYMDNTNADRLVRTYADTILRISYMYLKQTSDAEDICQDVFLKLLSGDHVFDDENHEKAWIIRATINAYKDHLRTGFWKHSIDLDNANEIESPEEPESEILEYVMMLPKNLSKTGFIIISLVWIPILPQMISFPWLLI